ncbi:hypothetical protein VTO42DRAFT_5798 [Malbranchea cinnamomea]
MTSSTPCLVTVFCVLFSSYALWAEYLEAERGLYKGRPSSMSSLFRLFFTLATQSKFGLNSILEICSPLVFSGRAPCLSRVHRIQVKYSRESDLQLNSLRT